MLRSIRVIGLEHRARVKSLTGRLVGVPLIPDNWEFGVPVGLVSYTHERSR